MNQVLFVVIFLILGRGAGLASAQNSDPADLGALRSGRAFEMIERDTRKIHQAATNSAAFERLAELCDRFGARPTGSTNLESAIDWIVSEMRGDGLEVKTEPVKIKNTWRRGAESAELIQPRSAKLHLLGLGRSLPTPPQGIRAEVAVVDSLAEVANSDLKGKIVLINEPFTSYGETVKIRSRGAIEAARKGAVACLIRSVAPFSMQSPHTGMMRYSPDVPKIPAAALSTEDASMLARMAKRGEKVEVILHLQSESLEVDSRNVIAEFPGRQSPEEIVVIGGHVDSWDVGQGAMDDAGGCVATWEALRLIKVLGLKPRRTIRVVFWTNEENGVDGAVAYRDLHKEELPRHIAALESDQGVFRPIGFNYKGTESAREFVTEALSAVHPMYARKLLEESDDTDLYPLRDAGVPCFDLVVSRDHYFWYHHSEADTVDKLSAGELNECIAAIATLAYSLAEMPVNLPR